MTYEEEIKHFEHIVNDMCGLFARKRADYGPSTTLTWKKFGPVSMLTRMNDKLNRLESLLCEDRVQQVTDESISDTLIDLANYCIITIIELRKLLEEGDNIGQKRCL